MKRLRLSRATIDVLCLCSVILTLATSCGGNDLDPARSRPHGLLPMLDLDEYPDQAGEPDGRCIAFIDLLGGVGTPDMAVEPLPRAYPWASALEGSARHDEAAGSGSSEDESPGGTQGSRPLFFVRFPKHISAQDFVKILIPLDRAITPCEWSGGVRVASVTRDGRAVWARLEEGGARATIRWVLRQDEGDQQVSVFLCRETGGEIGMQVYDDVRRVPLPDRDLWEELARVTREPHSPYIAFNVMVQPDLTLTEWLPAFLRLQHKMKGIGRLHLAENQ